MLEFNVNNKYDLPELCFSVTPEGDLVCISFGSPGYSISSYNTDSIEANKEMADYMNKKLKASKEQVCAMIHGSMFGWDTAGCNPDLYKDKSLDDKISMASKYKNCHVKEMQSKQMPDNEISL